MSLPSRPSFQKPTKSSSSASSSSSAGGAAGGRWNGNYSAGVSPVRGLSPVRGNFHGVARQDIDIARSHNNPLFSSRTSDIGRVTNTPTKACKDCKENREMQEPWKVPTEKAQYGGKTLCSTPGKSSRTTATMRFTTPPKPVVKRKILAENRELVTGTPRMREEEIKQVAATSTLSNEVVGEPVSVSQSRNNESHCRADDGLSSLSPERTSGDSSKPQSPLVSIEELQKRIQKFLQEEETTAVDVSVPMSPRQSTESLRRSLSGTAAGEESSCLTDVEGAAFQPVVAPYSPRPEFLRARKSPTPPVSMERNNVSPLRGEDSLIQEKTTPTYDPKNNFLSPRPQFLRYRPLRRLELLRKSAEGTLADLDLESPATDAESSRMGSEKDDKEESDLSQDVSQEVQSLKSCLESPPRCKVSSRKLFKLADPVNEEIVQLCTEEPEQSISSMKPPPETDAAALDVPSTHLEFEAFEKEEDEEELEDADSNNNKSSAWYNALSILTAFALVVLLVVASGSPSLLPTSLHQNHISHLWKTSKTTESIRQFLQTTEGLWAENPYLRDFSLSSPDMLRGGWVRISARIQSVGLSEAVKNGKVLWSSCMEYSARLGRLTKESFVNFKSSLEEEIDFYSSHSEQEVNEWGWVPDYEFVVPRDMFDPVEAYANIMARVESWKVTSFWSSLIQSYAKHPSTENLDSGMASSNSSLCSLSASPEDQVILAFRPASAPGSRVIADVPVPPPCHDVELNSNVPERSEEGTHINLHEPNAVSGGAEHGLLSVQSDDQDLEVGDVVTELSPPDVANTEAENGADEYVQVEPFPSPAEEEIPLSPSVEVVQMSHDAEEIQPARDVEDLQVLEPILSQDQPPSLQESLQGESSGVRPSVEGALPLPSIPDENNIDSYIPLETKPETPLSLVREKLMHAASLRTTAAFATTLLVAVSVVALLMLHRINIRFGKSRKANLNASSAQRFSKSSSKPQFREANGFQPVKDFTGNDFLVDDSSEVQLTPDHVKRFSTPYPVTFGTPNRTLGNAMGKDLTPEKSFKRVTDEETLESPDTLSSGILQDSSLGRFITLVPVVHNEGTARERVQLTPVRRSSRLRTRMQNSPCSLMHSPHHCNC